MRNNNVDLCRCCGGDTDFVFSGMLLNHQVKYFDCSNCGYVQTESPYWLEEAYSEAINDSDTGIMARNQYNARAVLVTMWLMGELKGTLVDCAGGYGILVRLLRDFGINALWSDRYCQNLLAKGFEHTDQSAILATAFEAFEHFVNPEEELDRLLSIAPNVLFSTDIISDPAPRQDDWWYYGREHGQHIGFFRIKTLKMIAEKRDKYFYSNGTSYHFISEKPINSVMWNFLLRRNQLLTLLIKKKLHSKTWSDHLLAAGR